jgi:hypothetical protein
MADVSGKFYSATKVRTGVSPSSPGVEVGETLPPVNPPGSDLNSVGLTMPAAFNVANSPLTSNGTIAVTGAGTVDQYVRGDGTLASFPSLTGYVPYTGATADVNLGTHDLTAERGTFQNNGSSDTLTVNHTSGSGYGIIVTKGGNNEALYVSKTSGSGNAMTVVGGRTSLVDLALSSVTNTAGDFLTLSGGVVHKRTAAEVRTDIGAGTVTSVAALTLGTSGTDLSSTVANGTTTPVITLNVPTASATNRGALSSADWTTFNNKQNALTNPVTGTGTTNTLAKFTGSTTIGNSLLTDNGTNGGYNNAGVAARTFIIQATSGRPLALEVIENANVHAIYLYPNNSGFNRISSDYMSGGVFLPLSLTGRENNADLVLQTSGNVTIGTTTDAGFKLDVNGTGRFSGALTINGASATTSLNVQGSGANGILLDQNSADANSSSRLFFKMNTQTYAMLADVVGLNFLSGATASSSSGSTKMILTSGGQLLVGTGSTDSGISVDFQNLSSSSSNVLVRAKNTTLNEDCGFVISANSSGTQRDYIIGIQTIVNSPDLTFSGPTGFQWYVAGSPRLTISSTGAATFSSSVTANGNFVASSSGTAEIRLQGGGYAGDYNTSLRSIPGAAGVLQMGNNNINYILVGNTAAGGFLSIRVNVSAESISSGTEALRLNSNATTTFSSLAGSGNRIVVANSAGTLISAVIGSGLAFDGTTLTATGGSSGSISGSGTSGTVALFTGSSSIGNSVITQTSGRVSINSGISDYHQLSVKSNGALTYQGLGVYSSSNDRFISMNHTGTEGFIETENAGSGVMTPLSFKTSGQIRFSITTGGNVMIGTTTDNGARLQVNGRSTFTGISGETISATGVSNEWVQRNVGSLTTGQSFGMTINAGTNSSDVSFNVSNAASTIIYFRVRGDGASTFSSSVTATSFFESSDATIKTLVEDAYQAKGIDSVVAKLYIKNGKQELGYFAQDLEGVLPSAVSKGSDGLLNLSYREVHTAKIAYLEEEIRQIKKRYEIN